MPWGNGTGPMGYGPMTGRGAGYCAVPLTGYANPVFGRGFLGTAYYGAPETVDPSAVAPYGPAAYYGGFGSPYGFGRFYGFGRGHGLGRGFGRGCFGRGRGLGRRW
ncbi:MAG: DUF5320 domain-containing protein [Thermodesulfobacteriota bacterium]|nr:DUF5320 domain-containing protein [Thermodesulfobacteriota bacterium]